MLANQAVAFAAELLDAKDDLITMLGEVGPRMLGECLATMRRLFDDC